MIVVTPDYKYKTTTPISYEGVDVEAGYIFDGVTAPFPVSMFFTAKDYRRGLLASCVHDWMCDNKNKYKRKHSTHLLIKLWKQCGLKSWKAWMIYIFIEIYQMFTSNKEWGTDL